MLRVVPLLLIVTIVACGTSHLDEVRASVDIDSTSISASVVLASVLRDACLTLKAVDYRYSALDEQLPLSTLRKAAYQDLRVDGDVENARFNCERYWLYPADDVVRMHFNDFMYQKIINTCATWLAMSPPPSWSAFRNAFRAENRDSWPTREKARLRKLGVTFGSTNDIYYEFDKSESRIAGFCNEAVQL